MHESSRTDSMKNGADQRRVRSRGSVSPMEMYQGDSTPSFSNE